MHVHRTDQRNLPASGSYSYALDGSGTTLYVIDTGLNPAHTQFGGRATQILNVIGDGQTDCNGHGTHVSSIAAGADFGIAKNATIYMCKALDCTGSGTLGGVITCLAEVADRQISRPHMAVVSMSLAGPADASTNNAVNNLVSVHNVPVVSAAGNNNGNACALSPASAAKSLTVAATTTTDTRASFSNFGSCVKIAAPGVGILGAWFTGNTATAVLSGTSMATPLVAGVMLLEMQRRGAGAINAASAQAAVLAMATAGKIAMPAGSLPLLYSNEGFPVPSPVPVPLKSPAKVPSPKKAPALKAATPRGRIGRQSVPVPSGAPADSAAPTMTVSLWVVTIVLLCLF